jgi:HlyD family secretion protein
MGFKTKAVMGILAVVVVGGGLTYWTLGRDKAPKSQLIKGTVDRGNVRIAVTATGTLEAVRTVQVGSQISGQIAALYADYNSQVKKGQLLAEIDPRTFKSQVLTEEAQNAAAQARMQSSQADLINQEANLVQVEANLKVAQVANENAQLLYDRAKQLSQKGLIPQSELDVARTNAESAAAKVTQAEAGIRQAQAQIRSRQAGVEQVKSDIVGAKAQLERAQINLDLTRIYSPVDGVVISRSVDIGQTVAASMSAPILFLIANDLTRMQVKANIDEADIGKITPEVRVSFTVDAYPNDTFTGQINEVRLEPQTVQNVVTYGVIIGVENPQLKLKPGMTTNLTMIVDEHTDVLTVPNAALRFNPPGLKQEEITKMIQDLPQLPAQAAAPEPIPAQPGQQASQQPSESRGEPGQGGGGRRGRGGRGQGGGREGGGFSGGSGSNGGAEAGSTGSFGGGNGGGGRSGGGFAGGGQGGGTGRREGASNAGGNAGFATAGGGQGGGRGARGGGGRNQRSVLWTQDPMTLAFKPVRVRLGLNDGTRTEVAGPDIKEGMEIIIGDLSQSTNTNTQQQRGGTNNPFVPGNIGGGNRGRGF